MSDPGESSQLFLEPSELHARVKKQLPTFGLTLRGAVIRTWRHGDGRLGLLVRDTDYRSSTVVHVDVPMPEQAPERGTRIEVMGELIEQQREQLTIERLWRGEMLRIADVAPGFLRRQLHAHNARARARLVVPTDRCEKLYVVTSRGSKAWPDIAAALAATSGRTDHVLAPRARERVECNLYQPERIAEAVNLLCERVKATDLVIVARGGGEWLDHFEEESVVTALARLAEQCPTYTAIGHADDTLILQGIVHGMFETPSAAIYRLDEMLREARRSAARESAGTRDRWSEVEAERDSGMHDAHAAGRSPELDPWRPAPAQPAPPWSPKLPSNPRRGEWRVALVVIVVIAALSILLLLVSPAPRSITSPHATSGAQAESADKAPHGAQTDRSAAQKPSEKSGRTLKRSAQGRDVSFERRPARAASEPAAALQRPAIEPAAIGEAPPMPMPGVAMGDPSSASPDREGLRLVASLIAPFEVGRDLGAARAACASSHGMWSSASCRLPGGRVYGFGLHGGLVQIITLRQGEKTPLPLFSSDALAALQQLAASGRGPWRVAVTPTQLVVQPRPHHPGF